MPLAEQSERVGGAALLGVPAFDAFVWVLDNYARIELLVRLQEHLPPFILSPVTSFVCMCIGLGLLYQAHKSHLAGMAKSSGSGLVDTSNAELRSAEKPLWLRPVAIVFLVALFATPILAIAYSLAEKGPPLPPLAPPHPPFFAYFKTPTKQVTRTTSQPNVQVNTAPYGIAIGGGTVTNPTVNNNFAQPDRRILGDQRAVLVDCLKTNPGKATVASIENNGEAYRYAQDWYEIFSAATWNTDNDQHIPIEIFALRGGMWSGMHLSVHGTFDNVSQRALLVDASPEKTLDACLDKAHIGGVLIPYNDIPTGSVRLDVSDRPKDNR